MSNEFSVPSCPGVDPRLDQAEPRQCEAETLAGAVRRSLTQVARRMRHQRGEADLPEGQHSALSALYYHGAMTPGGLAEHEYVKPPPMTRTINMLAEAGLVSKKPHPTDGRQIVVELTDLGISDVLDTRRRREQWLADRIDQLSPEDQAVLRHATGILSRLGT